jgi:radical SAM protein with 4Fe4S-binding SPASM domain
LLYSRFPDLANILNENRCFATICTNGILLDQFKGVIAHNPYLTFLISLDGIEGENDLIRGRGVYKKAIENIKLLKALKKPPYVGIQFTILPENVRNMYAFCRKMVSLGVDWILLNPAWFITDKQARDYECFLDSLFHVRAKTHLGYHFSYKIDTDEFSRQYSKIKNSRWPIQISCYLNNPAEDMHSYVNSGQFLSQNIFCYKQWVRLDILPSGEVAPCVRFPDLVFGDLHTQDILSIWNSTHFAEFRNIIMKNPLPVCNKCNSAYLYDARRKYL